MYKKILLPVALDHEHDPADAIAVAKALKDADGELILLHVVEPIPAHIEAQIPESILKQTHEDALTGMTHAAAKAGSGAHGVVATGMPGTTILDFAKDKGCDCIVVASHRPGLSDYFLGSTAARVVRHAECAVHVMR